MSKARWIHVETLSRTGKRGRATFQPRMVHEVLEEDGQVVLFVRHGAAIRPTAGTFDEWRDCIVGSQEQRDDRQSKAAPHLLGAARRARDLIEEFSGVAIPPATAAPVLTMLGEAIRLAEPGVEEVSAA